MEETDIKTGKFGWTYGLIAGLISVAFGLIIYFMDMTLIVIQSSIAQLIGPLIIIIMMILGIINYKKANDGYITISKALKVACGIGLISGIISLLFNYIIGVIDPELTQNILDYYKEQAYTYNPKMTDEEWNAGLKIQTMFGYAIMIIFPVIIGLIVGAITGAIVQNKRPE